MIDSDVTLLPQPDSPTRPMISPRSTWKSMPSTARTTPSRVWNDVRRPRTSSRRSSPRSAPSRAVRDELLDDRLVEARDSSVADRRRAGADRLIGSPVQPRVERVAQAVAEQVEPEDGQVSAMPGKRIRCGAVNSWLRSSADHRAPLGDAAAARRGRGTTGPRPRARPPPMPSVPCDDQRRDRVRAGSAGRGCRSATRRAPATRSRSPPRGSTRTDARMIRA